MSKKDDKPKETMVSAKMPDDLIEAFKTHSKSQDRTFSAQLRIAMQKDIDSVK